MSKSAWKTLLKQRLPLLGHRNWIGVVDSAYPWQNAAGIETVATNTSHYIVLKTVLDAIDSAAHIRPLIYLDAEFPVLSEKLAPGINDLRKKVDPLLGENTSFIPHEKIIARLDTAARLFRVLLFKTTLTLPYTSVFLELDCGYWSAASERALRTSYRKNHEST